MHNSQRFGVLASFAAMSCTVSAAMLQAPTASGPPTNDEPRQAVRSKGGVYHDYVPIATKSVDGLLDPKSSPLALIFERFRESGWPPDLAIAHAHRLLGLPYPDNLGQDVKPDPSAPLLNPDSSPLAILYELYRQSGWAPDDAIRIAHIALGLNLNKTNDECGAYHVFITYCDGSTERQLEGFLNSRCYEDPDGNPQTADGLNMCAVAQCQQGQYSWFSLTVVTSCSNLPTSGTCIQMRVNGSAVSIDCAEIDYECSCFSETASSVICANIESCCCKSPTLGCNGCPSCSSPCAPP